MPRSWLLALLAVLLAACSPSPPSPSPEPKGSPESSPSALPSALPSPLAGDPCHINGQVYCLVNPDVSFATRGSTICVSGWTATVRPPVSYTDDLKVRQMAAENLPGTTADYEEDHRLPLTGGGYPGGAFVNGVFQPGPVENLSPESRSGAGSNSGAQPASAKDTAEFQLGRALCNASSEPEFLSLQVAFVKQWLLPFPGYPDR